MRPVRVLAPVVREQQRHDLSPSVRTTARRTKNALLEVNVSPAQLGHLTEPQCARCSQRHERSTRSGVAFTISRHSSSEAGDGRRGVRRCPGDDPARLIVPGLNTPAKLLPAPTGESSDRNIAGAKPSSPRVNGLADTDADHRAPAQSCLPALA